MRIFWAVAWAVASAAPASARTDRGLKYLEQAARRAAAPLEGKLAGKVCVLDLTMLSAPEETSEFGQKAAELIAARLVQRSKGRYRVVERRELIKIARDSVLIEGDDEAVFKRIREQAGMDVLVSGTYSVSGGEASLDVKAVDARTMTVLAAGTERLARTEGLERMLARRIVAGRAAGDGAAEKSPAGPAPQGAETGPRGEADPIEFEVGVFYEGGDGKLYPLRDGMVLNSKDNYALYVKPSKPSYVYAYQVDSSQKAFPIFPNPDYAKAANPLPAREAWIPEGGEYLYLDENPGREEIYVFATRTPSPALEALKTVRLSDIEQTIKTMGVAGKRGALAITKAKGVAGNPLELITRKLTAQGDFFWKTSFVHQ